MRNLFVSAALLISAFLRIHASEFMVPVCKDGQWGLIDRAGKVVVAPQFDEIWRPFNPLIPVGPKDCELLTGTEERILVRKGALWGFVNERGQWVIPARFTHATHFHDGLAGAMLDGRWSFIDPKGDLILSLAGVQGGYLFSEGLAPIVRTGDGVAKWGFVDRNGKEAIPTRLDQVRSFQEGLAPAREGGKWGYLGQQGQWAIPLQYDDADYFFNGLARAVKDGKAGFLARDGRWVIPPQYDQAQRFSEGLAGVSDGKRCGFVDAKGDVRIPLTFQDARSFREGLAAAAMEKRYGFIGKDGQWVLKPEYEMAEDFSEGLAIVGCDGRFGFVDKAGKLVVPCQFDEARPFKGGLAEVRIDEKWGYVDATGTYVWEPTD